MLPDDDGAGFEMPHGRRALCRKRGQQSSQLGLQSAETLVLQKMGERAGDQVLRQRVRWFAPPRLAPQRSQLVDVHRGDAAELGIEIRGGRQARRPPTRG